MNDPRLSRQLAVGLLVVAVLAVVALIAIPAWLVHRHYDVAISDNLDKLDRFRRIAATRPALARQLDAMSSRDPRKFFLRTGPAALSAAEAQEAIRALIESSGGRLVFGADSRPTEQLVEFARGAELLLIEATLPRPERTGERGHLTPREAGEHGRDAGAGRLVLTHISDELDHLWARKEAQDAFRGPVEVAREGAVYEL